MPNDKSTIARPSHFDVFPVNTPFIKRGHIVGYSGFMRFHCSVERRRQSGAGESRCRRRVVYPGRVVQRSATWPTAAELLTLLKVVNAPSSSVYKKDWVWGESVRSPG